MRKIVFALVGALTVVGLAGLAFGDSWGAQNFTYGWHANRTGRTNSGCDSKLYIHMVDNIAASAKTGSLDNFNCSGTEAGVDVCTIGTKTYYRCVATTPDAAPHKVLIENTFDGACAAQTGDMGFDTLDVKRTASPVTPLGTVTSGTCIVEPAAGSFTGNPGFRE